MLSWQAKILYQLLHVLACCKLLPKKLDAISLRKKLDWLARWIKINKKIQLKKSLIDNISATWFLPNNAKDTIIFYLHGGAYCLGSINTYRYLLANIAKTTQAKIFAINYRLAPEHPFPAALEDVITAYQWLLKNNFSEQQIIIAGDSAGGGLSLATLIALRDRSIPLPRAAIILSPWLDLAMTGESVMTNSKRDYLINPELAKQAADLYLQTVDPMNPLASPLYANLNQLPPIYIQVGSAEILLDDAIRFAEKAKNSGVNIKLDIWPEMIHGWHFFNGLMPESQSAITKMKEFMGQL